MRLPLAASFFALLLACGSDGESSQGEPDLYGCDGEDFYDAPALDWLMGTWLGGYGTDRDDRLTFARGPRRFTQEISRQVGNDETPEIPYPTSCRYRQVSETMCLNDISRGDAGMPSYRLSFRVGSIELIEHPENDAACSKYLEEQRSRIESGQLQYDEDLAQGANGNLVLDGDEPFARAQ